jgi:hypothetical protein
MGTYHSIAKYAVVLVAKCRRDERVLWDNRRPRVTGRLRRKLLSRGKRNRHASKFVTRQMVLFGSLQALALPYQKSRDYYYPFNIIARHLNYSR